MLFFEDQKGPFQIALLWISVLGFLVYILSAATVNGTKCIWCTPWSDKISLLISVYY